MKIVSLLPSATEIICSIGLRPQLVGITHECDYPVSVEGLPVVTRSLIAPGLSSGDIDALVREQLTGQKALYSLRMDVLEQLRPDLIVSQSLCDVCAVAADEVQAAACELPGNPRVINLEPMSLAQVLDTILEVGRAADREAAARATVSELSARVDRVRARSATIAAAARPRVAVLEWLDPLFNAGHWTPELVEYAGGLNCLGSPQQPSTTLTWERLETADPDVVLVALCGFNVTRSLVDVRKRQAEPHWQALRAVREGRVLVMDGNAYFSRPGPRLVDSLEILAHALHPRVHAPSRNGERAVQAA